MKGRQDGHCPEPLLPTPIAVFHVWHAHPRCPYRWLDVWMCGCMVVRKVCECVGVVPMVGMDRTSSPSCRRYKMVVLPAASNPAHQATRPQPTHTRQRSNTRLAHPQGGHAGRTRLGRPDMGHAFALSLGPLAWEFWACPRYIFGFNVCGVPSMRMRFSDLPDSASSTREKRPPMLNYCTRAPNACFTCVHRPEATL